MKRRPTKRVSCSYCTNNALYEVLVDFGPLPPNVKVKRIQKLMLCQWHYDDLKRKRFTKILKVNKL